MTPVFRFAPSPTGLLHLGHAASAAAVWRAAKAAGGRLLLRIEDIDPVRSKPEFAAAIEDDLAWLGFSWDGPVVRQSERLDLYAAALAKLDTRGLLYSCRLSRTDIAAAAAPDAARDPDGAVRLPLAGARPSDPDGPVARRLHMAKALATLDGEPLTWWEEGVGAIEAQPERWGDVVLARKETPTSYHLAVVVDDAAQGVTHVVRGRDLYEATAVHRLLQRLLDLPEPAYRHHPLLMAPDGAKLSKSRGSPSLRSLREEGWSREDVLRAAGAL
ncbi:tRNA glutamyl-Q(34) synthetase GluQRS [Methylopila sp. Yamaguchi]|uniref:tRNA glutamyl-Q(34) synthetase GluQRS n=1 Tax=Methylopila sp. Yamaguchi TaxID=1437817 RepID=UPI000CB45E20|nr:tRNA glutamyl-Q(34) synthetase GluQRS [Methylopila sp. Yamaguchi]GBD49221.1 glutamyl/glutaminyl-tRNA synthetase [Methylopila sp. Yamaguchi]